MRREDGKEGRGRRGGEGVEYGERGWRGEEDGKREGERGRFVGSVSGGKSEA